MANNGWIETSAGGVHRRTRVPMIKSRKCVNEIGHYCKYQAELADKRIGPSMIGG